MSHSAKSGSKAPEQTFEEVKYLKHLIEAQIPVSVKLSNNEVVKGIVEYFDKRFLRITRDGEPNLFIFKHDIKYLIEEGA
ncbi:MAG TPA: Sm ribonucleo-like protein [Solibacterales bacterium]|nr:Sm ribonucleo-like protein [Bryobacterales bacterium]